MKRAYLVAGLGFGDEGKGATVDYLCRQTQSRLVVRYNGGPQAAHNVISPDGIHHTFSQFGSGSLLPDVWTLCSRYMLVNPLNMLRESVVLKGKGIEVLGRTAVSDESLIITPFNVALNRAKAAQRGGHSTCGQGIGQAREDHRRFGDSVIFAGDTKKPSTLRAKLTFLRDQSRVGFVKTGQPFPISYEHIEPIAEAFEQWAERVTICDDAEFLHFFSSSSVIFEGAQGVLLDETFGDPDFNTWTDCTFRNALVLLSGMQTDVVRLGVLRTYHTRHGDGPFPTEDNSLKYPELHNGNGNYQGRFRIGCFDSTLAAKALNIIGGVDEIALNHLDVCPAPLAEQLTPPISIRGYGPKATDRTKGCSK